MLPQGSFSRPLRKANTRLHAHWTMLRTRSSMCEDARPAGAMASSHAEASRVALLHLCVESDVKVERGPDKQRSSGEHGSAEQNPGRPKPGPATDIGQLNRITNTIHPPSIAPTIVIAPQFPPPFKRPISLPSLAQLSDPGLSQLPCTQPVRLFATLLPSPLEDPQSHAQDCTPRQAGRGTQTVP